MSSASARPNLRGDVDERAVALVAVEPIEVATPEADEEVQLSVVVEVRPAVGLRAALVEELRLHRLEGRLPGRGRRLGLAQRLERQPVLRVRLDLRAAVGQREVLALPPVRNEVRVVRAARLVGIARHAQPLRRVPVLDVEDEHERRARHLLRARGGRVRRGHHRVPVAAAPHGVDVEQRLERLRRRERVHEVGRVEIAPLPRRHVVAQPALQIRHRLVERAEQDPVACGVSGAGVAP